MRRARLTIDPLGLLCFVGGVAVLASTLDLTFGQAVGVAVGLFLVQMRFEYR